MPIFNNSRENRIVIRIVAACGSESNFIQLFRMCSVHDAIFSINFSPSLFNPRKTMHVRTENEQN